MMAISLCGTGAYLVTALWIILQSQQNMAMIASVFGDQII